MPIKARTDLTADDVRKVLSYDPETGILRWRHSLDRRKEWNSRRADKPAGHVTKTGVVSIRVGDHLYLAHRLIWLMETGEWPQEEIDHRSGDQSDNRWQNLREATRSQNTFNRGKPANNSSGFVGVRFRAHHGKWEGRVTVGRKTVWRAYFTTAQEAAAARRAVLPSLHGDFAKV